MQEIYINLDDSGKLTFKEKICVYGGLVFLSKKDKDKFITQYKSIIKEIKCWYCNNKQACNNKCPEIKNTNIKPNDKRRLMNYIKKYYRVALVIINDNVYDHIKKSKSAKGRFVDYSIRRMIKNIIINLIELKKINPKKPIRLIINIDQQSTKSNGYYNLKDGLIEELKYGIVNYNYSNPIKPLVYDDLDVCVSYQDSGKSYLVQAADLLAGTIRRTALEEYVKNNDMTKKLNKITNFQIILP